jgi:molybdopterin molybdotransferase
MISVTEALGECERRVSALPSETVLLEDALQRVLADRAVANTDLPPFTQSAMDGYALHSVDTVSAETGKPVSLRIVGQIAAEPRGFLSELGAGSACRIFTGGGLPPGADTVIRQESVSAVGGELRIDTPVSAGSNVRPRGEEITRGQVMVGAGTRLVPGMIGALAAVGVGRVTVYRQPRILILVTGSEVVPAGEPLAPGTIYDANGPLARTFLNGSGYRLVAISRVPDSEEALAGALGRAFGHADLIISTGGVSVGDRDLVISIAERLGVQRIFWKIAQQPGKPLYLGLYQGRIPVLGLPGNPAAALIGILVYLRRILDCLEGASTPGPVFLPGKLAAAVRSDKERTQWVRARRRFHEDGSVWLEPLAKQGPHMISNLCAADALVYLPPAASYSAICEGTAVSWVPM